MPGVVSGRHCGQGVDPSVGECLDGLVAGDGVAALAGAPAVVGVDVYGAVAVQALFQQPVRGWRPCLEAASVFGDAAFLCCDPPASACEVPFLHAFQEAEGFQPRAVHEGSLGHLPPDSNKRL
jgi:hypothetical protein